jgi:hypothetical protein
VAGFSERLTRVVVGGAELSIASALGGDDAKPAGAAKERAAGLELLARLRAQGRLTNEEYETAKGNLLGA